MLEHYSELGALAAAPWAAAAPYVGDGWLRAVAGAAFAAGAAGEIDVAEGDEILVNGDDPAAPGWVRAVGAVGEPGLVPAALVTYADEVVAPAAHTAVADGELSFAAGEALLVRPAEIGRSWWLARTAAGAIGYAPRHIVDPAWRRVAALAVEAIVHAWRDYCSGDVSAASRRAKAVRLVRGSLRTADGVRALFRPPPRRAPPRPPRRARRHDVEDGGDGGGGGGEPRRRRLRHRGRALLPADDRGHDRSSQYEALVGSPLRLSPEQELIAPPPLRYAGRSME